MIYSLSMVALHNPPNPLTEDDPDRFRAQKSWEWQDNTGLFHPVIDIFIKRECIFPEADESHNTVKINAKKKKNWCVMNNNYFG